jgi:hypothetical protein
VVPSPRDRPAAMAQRKRRNTRRSGTLVVMDETGLPHRVCTTQQAADILQVTVGYVRQLARRGEIWCGIQFGKRAPVYDADQLEARAAKVAKERAAGLRQGRPPAAISR